MFIETLDGKGFSSTNFLVPDGVFPQDDAIYNRFNLQHHLSSGQTLRQMRPNAAAEWHPQKMPGMAHTN
jgi:hypothetical protein